MPAGFNHWRLWQREVRVWGETMQACSLDRLVYLLLNKVRIMGERAFFTEAVRPGMTVVEAGSNLGLYTLLFSRLVGPEGIVHACEPDPRLFAMLKQNLRRNGVTNVRAHRCAVGAMPEQRLLRTGGLNSGDNRLAASPNAAVDAGPETTLVEVQSLDALLQRQKVDFVKVDVQGWEAEVFKGMTAVAAANPQMRVFFEFWPYGLRGAGCEPLPWLRSLQADGWDLHADLDGRPFDFAKAAALDRGGKRFCNLIATRKGQVSA